MDKLTAKLRRVPPGGLAALAAAAACLPLLGLPLVFDDVMSVRDNALLRTLASAAALFSPDYTRVFRNEGFEPLTFLTLMLWGKLFAWQAWGLHLLSLLGHAACSWAVYRLALNLLGSQRTALAAGLFFALHPVQGESLVAVLFSGTIFSALFFLLALNRFIEGDGRHGFFGGLLTALLFAVSLLFKERAFSGLLLFCLLPLLRPGGPAQLRRRLPELLLLTTLWAGALLSRLAAARGSGLGLENLDPAYLLARLAAYAKMLMLPFWLSPVYQKTSPWPDALALASLCAAGALLYAAFKYSGRGERGYPPAAVGAALLGLLLLPYLNLLPVSDLAEYLNSVFVSGRYLYLPLAGAAVLFGAAGGALAQKYPALPLKTAAAALLCLYAGLGAAGLLAWRSDEAVWARAARLNPQSAWAHYMLGSFYMQAGAPNKALPELERALALNPARGVRSNTLGAVAASRLMLGEAAEAEKSAVAALKTWDQNFDAWNSYGAALAALGKREKAVKAFEVAASAEMTGDAPLVNLGKLYLELGRPAQAVNALERALERSVTPDSLDLLCGAYAAAGLKEKEALCRQDAARLGAAGR